MVKDKSGIVQDKNRQEYLKLVKHKLFRIKVLCIAKTSSSCPYCSVDAWNSLPAETVSAQYLESFKRRRSVPRDVGIHDVDHQNEKE